MGDVAGGFNVGREKGFGGLAIQEKSNGSQDEGGGRGGGGGHWRCKWTQGKGCRITAVVCPVGPCVAETCSW